MSGAEKPEIALEARAREAARLFSPSAARNRDFIRAAFLKTMPLEGALIEVGSGTGEHCVHLAAAAPDLDFLPGDPDAASRASIAAWTAHSGLLNIAPPHDDDVAAPFWHRRFEACDVVLSINMIHIAPFEAARGLVAGAAQLLKPRGRLFLYGPFSRDGVHTATSNAEFDRTLKSRDPRWGVRDLDRDIAPICADEGLKLVAVEEMPANNLSVVFARA